MSVETLENLLKNPDIWDISLSTQNMHDVLVEIASRVDSLMAGQDKIKPINNDKEEQTFDVNDFTSRIDALSKQLERQNTDFGSEIQDLRALFNFQLRDIREKMDRNITSIKDSMSRPSSPPPAVIQQIPDTDANFETERKLHSLSKDISSLKERMRTILKVLKELPEIQSKVAEDEENKNSVNKEAKSDVEATSSNKLLIDGEPDVDLTSQTSQLNTDEPLTPNEDDPFSTSRIKDSRYDDIVEDIEFMKKERKNDTERLNSTIKAVNQLIAEKDNSTNKINQCVRESNRFNDEFDRLYQKMAEFQVEVDKKISEALNVRINTDIKSVPASSNDQPLELPNFKEGFSDDIAQMDNGYKQQINYLKLEIAQLKQVLSDRMLIPDSKSSVSRSNVEVQTDESLTNDIPTRHANVDVQKTRVANEIMTQVIVSRTPIQYMAINQEYVNMMKKFQPQSQQQTPQQSTEKSKPVKRQRRPVSTSNIEIQTNEENAKDQPDVNPPNDDDPETRNGSSSSSSKAGSRSKRMRSSHSNRKVTYIDSTTETQAEISGIGSPLRTPPRTPLRSQNQKRKVELIDILIETDPDITGEPLGITPDLLEKQPTNQEHGGESNSEEEEVGKGNEMSQDQQKPKSPTKVDNDTTTNEENVKTEKKKTDKKKSNNGKDIQKSQTVENDQNQDKSKQEEEEEPTQSGNVGTEIKSKTPPLPRPSDKSQDNKNNQSKENEKQAETDVKKETDQSTNQNDQQQKESESESQSKSGTPQTGPDSQKVSRTETPEESEKQPENKSETQQQPITTNKNVKRKKEKVVYADSGISMQINTYEKEIKERNEQDDQEAEEVEVVDIEIQTDEISEEELSMYSIFNQESNPDLLKDMGDMTYMERYSTSGANTNIGLSNQGFQNQYQQKVNGPFFTPQRDFSFSFEHLLSLTIISEIKNTDQPQDNVPTLPDSSKQGESPSSASQSQQQLPQTVTLPTTVDASNIDIQSIINKVLELSKNNKYDELNDQVNRHSRQITTLFKLVDEVKDSNSQTSNNINTSRDKSAPGSRAESKGGSSSAGSRVGSGIGNASSNQQQEQEEQQQEQSQQQQLQNQPGFTPSNPVVIADMIPNPNNQTAQVPPDLIERLDQFDDSIADLEDHIFSIEKKLIDKGALRPNSANPYGEDFSGSPFGPSIRADSRPSNSNNNEAYREPYYRHHHHHHRNRHGSGNNNGSNDPRSGEYENQESANEGQDHYQNDENNGELHQNSNDQPQKGNNGPGTPSQNNQPQNQQQQLQQPDQSSPNQVHAIASGPDKPRSNYYNQFTPGSLSKERNQNAKKETMEFIQGFTIDPDPEAMKPVEKEVVIPEDLTIPKYERQLRLLREAVVELRTNIQILRVKTDQPVIIQPTENVEPEPDENKNENAVDETTLRALRKKIELTFDDYSSQIADIRRELYLHLEQPPDRIIEVRTEVQKVEKEKDEDEGNKKETGKPAPAAPKDINVDLNLSKAIEMLADTQHKSVISIHKIELPPEVKEHRDIVQRLQHNNPIIENNYQNNGSIKPSNEFLQPPPFNENGSNNINNKKGDENDQQIDYTALPPPASTPLVTGVKNEGHYVPQIVQDMRVLNAMPKKDMLELLMPFLYQLRSELLMNIDSNTERIRCLENSVQSKVDKEFIESFFRKIRMAVKEADDKAMRACNSLFDKVSKQDLEDRVQELLKQIGTQETTVAGKTSYTCLFCGAKKTTLAKSSAQMEKGKLFKGRATRQSLQSSDLSQLPPLTENE